MVGALSKGVNIWDAGGPWERGVNKSAQHVSGVFIQFFGLLITVRIVGGSEITGEDVLSKVPKDREISS